MRLGNLEIRRARRELAGLPAPAGGELGSDGETWESRYPGSSDPNVIWHGSAKFGICKEMATTDSVVRAVLRMTEMPVTGAVWDFEDASDDPFDAMVAEACAWQFGLRSHEGQMDISWKASLRQAQLKNRYGAMFEEIVWGDPVVWTPDAGTPRLIRPIRRLAPRLPKTIRDVKREYGKIVEITQNLSETTPIPGDKLCYYVLDPEPGEWDGTSILRPAWGPWELKKQLMISSGIAWDRWASGFPVVRYPKNGGQAELATAEEMGRAIRGHERAYAAFAGAAPTDIDPDGWDIDIKGGPQNLPDPVPLLKQYDLLILWAGLLQWMGIATSARGGARATAQVQDEPYYMAVESFAEDLALERQRQAVRRFIDVNFGTEVKAPKLTVSKIQSEDVAQLAQTLAELKLAGFDFSDTALQNDVRERMHLPDLPEDTGEHVVEEGTGLPPALAPKAAPVMSEAAQLRAAERREERLHRQLERTVDGLIERLNSAPEPLPLPAPAAPIVIPITAPASTTEPQLVRLLEEAQTRMLEQIGEKAVLPPIHLEIKQGNKRSIVSKDADGNTIVEQQDL